MAELSTPHALKHNNTESLPRDIMAEAHALSGAQRQGRSKKRHRKSKKPKDAAAVDPHETFKICIKIPGQECLPLFQFRVEQTKQSDSRVSTSDASSKPSRIMIKIKEEHSERPTIERTIENKYCAEAANDTTNESSPSSRRLASNSAGRENQYETDQTSQDGSQILHERERKLKQTICQLQWDLEERDHELSISKRQYDTLKGKYDKQVSQRRVDYEKVQEWHAQFEEAQCRAEQLEEEVTELKAAQASTHERHNAELHAKDEEIEKLKADQQCAIDAMRNVYGEHLSEKIKETEEAKALAAKAKEDLEAAYETATTEQFALRKELETEQRTSKDSRTAYENMSTKAKDLQEQLLRTETDARDASSTDKATITSLVERNRQLEREVQQMSGLLKSKCPDARKLHHKVDRNNALRNETKALRDKVSQLTENNECLLDRVQQMSQSCIKHQRAEYSARREANRLQNVICDREEKIDRQHEQLRAAGTQLAERHGGEVTARFAALEAVERQNDDLRAAFLAQEAAKNDALHEAAKYEDIAGRRDIEFNLTELELAATRGKLEKLEERTEASMKELHFLRDFTRRSDHLDESTVQALSWVADFVTKFTWLESQYQELQQKHRGLQEEYDTIEDSMDTEYRKWKNECARYQYLYHYEKETTTKQLHDEIHRLKSANGEAHWIESEQPRNTKVAELNAQPFADDEWADPPVYGMLKTLRPHGASRLEEAGKVWEDRIFAPTSEEEVVRRIEAEERDKSEHMVQAQAVQPVLATAVYRQVAAVARVIESEERNDVQHTMPAQAVPSIQATAPFQAGAKAPRSVVLPGRMNKHRSAIKIAEPLVILPQPWESRFAQHMSKHDYEELDDDNKVDFYNAFVRGK